MFSLYIGGDDDTVTITSDAFDRGWVAYITGTHPTYRFERDFIAYQRPSDDRTLTKVEKLQDGDVLEREDHADGASERRYYVYRDGDLREISVDDVEDALLRGAEPSA